jgi:hypothetical protein
MASKTDTAQVACSFCGKSFLTQAEMEEHTKRDHTEQKDPAAMKLQGKLAVLSSETVPAQSRRKRS